MASGRARSRTHLLTFTSVLLAGCSIVGAAPTTSLGPTTTTSTTTTSTLATTTVPTTTTSLATTTSTREQPAEIDAEVRIPEGDGPFPAVVLVHGGAWVTGAPAGIRDLAIYLTDQGFLTVNPRYALSDDSPGFPQAFDDIACAVRYAAAHPESDGTVAIVGHSSGAHLGAVVALTGDLYGADCQVAGTGIPDEFVGMAGLYDVFRLGIVMLPFFGAGPVAGAESWAAGNPQGLTDENPDLASLILIGENDGLVDDTFGLNFNAALLESGSESTLEVVEGARHLDMVDPDVVGPLVATWLAR